MLYKEVIERKKLPVGTFLMFLLCIVLYVSKFTSMFFIGKNTLMDNVFNTMLMVVMIVTVGLEVYKSSVRYKYLIIADQLIIHKIIRNSKQEVENIKIKDIKFVGKSKELKAQFKISSTKKYICSLFKCNRYCCVYLEEGTNNYKKFYFEPSREMISKIMLIMNRDVEVDYLKERLKISV
ncbi:hypothetical protein ACER0A_001085 [Haloimpatiens sp. FM7315]|uniref:hypothetical protein n=1 Tax=Haloimpatiens sp. FM7315 TaxID=3298609 RepID=UPI0035A2FDF8